MTGPRPKPPAILRAFSTASSRPIRRPCHATFRPAMPSACACCVLQLCTDDRERQRQLALAEQGYPESFLCAVDADQASTLAGVAVNRPGLFFPGAGWVHPPSLCRAMLQHGNIRLLTHSEAM